MAGPDAQANGHSNGDAGAPPPQQQQRPAGLSFAGLAGRGRPRGAALGVHGPAAVAQRQAISGFGEGVDAVPVAAADKPVIPRQEDTFVVGRPQSDRGGRQRNPNRFLPDRADAAPVAVEEKFEVAAEEVVGPVTYGLQLVVTKTETVTTAPGRDGSPGAGPSDALATDGGRLANGRGSAANETQALSVTSRDWEARKLHEDLHRLADDPDLDQCVIPPELCASVIKLPRLFPAPQSPLLADFVRGTVRQNPLCSRHAPAYLFLSCIPACIGGLAALRFIQHAITVS